MHFTSLYNQNRMLHVLPLYLPSEPLTLIGLATFLLPFNILLETPCSLNPLAVHFTPRT